MGWLANFKIRHNIYYVKLYALIRRHISHSRIHFY